jgi:tRNA pseudouridine65 synthase
MQCEILWQDNYALAVNKPNNVLVHHSHYSGIEGKNSLLELLKEQGIPRVYPLHRLDRKTSGVVLLAKQRSDVAVFQKLFDEQTIQKTYLALLRGHIDAEGKVETPVRNDRGNYKEASTFYRCKEKFELKFAIEPYETSRYSLAEMEPKTGRLHQLRVHANKISHPIIGDPKHGNRHHNHFFAEQLGLPDLFLHAERLQFSHPFTNETIDIEAPLPPFWKRFFEISTLYKM